MNWWWYNTVCVCMVPFVRQTAKNICYNVDRYIQLLNIRSIIDSVWHLGDMLYIYLQLHVHVSYLFAQVADYLVDPLCRGVFASSPKSISLRSCFPFFHQYESKYGSIVMGMFRDSEGVVQSCDAWWIVGEDSSGMHLGMEGGAVFVTPCWLFAPPPPRFIVWLWIMKYSIIYYVGRLWYIGKSSQNLIIGKVLICNVNRCLPWPRVMIGESLYQV